MNKLLLTGLIFAGSATLPAAESKVHFEKQIWPILERSCLECHDKEKIVDGKRKRPKGGLRIDSPKMMMYGAKGDPVIIPGDAEESSFYFLTVLDKDDDDIMPAKGPILTKAESELLKKWINQGAHFGSWTGSEAKLSIEQIKLINKLNEGDIVIYPMIQGGIDLYIDFSRLREKGTDQDLKDIEILLPKTHELNLSGTHVRDISSLEKAVNLERLNLSKTDINEESLKSLRDLKNLKLLNLYGAKLKSVPELPKSLKKIYLANTKLSTAQLKELQQLRPELKIYSNWDINEVKKILEIAANNSADFNGVEVKVAPKAVPPPLRDPSDIVFEDFESGRYEKWKVTGTAFGTKAVNITDIPDHPKGINAIGKYLVNSFTSTESYAALGSMLSQEFIISRNWITFLIGGGAYENKTCMQLIVEGKVVAVAHGANSNVMSKKFFDTKAFYGKKAQLKIIDNQTGGWGHVGVDEIIFTNKK